MKENNQVVEKIKLSIMEAAKRSALKVSKEEISIEHPQNREFGDYACNVAMNLARKEKANPKEIATKIVEEIKKEKNDLIEKVEVAGAGFINFYIKVEYLVKIAEDMNYESIFGDRLSEYGKGKKVVIDYSSPNIAKPFGIGHLRSTNIGQALYNLYKNLGWVTIGDNHLGDWGTQFGKLIVAIKKWADKDISEMDISDLEKLYVKFHKEAKEDESLIEEGREWFSKLEKGDKEAKEIWQKCVDISMQEFDRVYQMLGVSIDFAHGESFYEEMLPSVIKEVEKKGLVKVSQGAKVIEFKDMPVAMIEKSNGTTTYFTRDLAGIKYRMEEWNPDLFIYEVGADQILHFRQLFETAKMLGYEPSEGYHHVAHGLIRWKSGKFSTRKGDTIHLADVVEAAKKEAEAIANKSKVIKEMGEVEKEEMIEAVAIGAIKYSDLQSDPKKDIIFDWEQIMSLEGDSGPYLQYAYARCRSILEKSLLKENSKWSYKKEMIGEDEVKMLRELYRFEEKIVEAAERFSPSVLVEYLTSVARSFNEYYAKNKIIGSNVEELRLFITQSTASVFSKGMAILGIKAIERM